MKLWLFSLLSTLDRLLRPTAHELRRLNARLDLLLAQKGIIPADSDLESTEDDRSQTFETDEEAEAMAEFLEKRNFMPSSLRGSVDYDAIRAIDRSSSPVTDWQRIIDTDDPDFTPTETE